MGVTVLLVPLRLQVLSCNSEGGLGEYKYGVLRMRVEGDWKVKNFIEKLSFSVCFVGN